MTIDKEVDKGTFRKQLLKRRQQMPKAEWQKKSSAICKHLEASYLLGNARTILAYTSFRQEPDLMPLIHHLAQSTAHPQPMKVEAPIQHRTLGFPRCAEKSLFWHQWHPDQPDAMVSGAYGILEPKDCLPLITPQMLGPQDVLLVPAAGCDRHGYRIGYGGGFYDRLLSQPEWSVVTTIGVVFDFAYVDQLPVDPWDQPLDGVCTENGLFMFKS